MTRLGILVSGRGSNLLAIMNACQQGKLNASVEVVISNNKDAQALEKARESNIKAVYFKSMDTNQHDTEMKAALQEAKVDYVVLAGYMKKIGPETLHEYKNRIFNIHPSLLPKFGGKGMFGLHVHEAVIAAGEKETGVTIHLVNDEYDDGAILAQQSVSVQVNDSPETLAARVLKIEHVLYADTIQKIIDGSIILPD